MSAYTEVAARWHQARAEIYSGVTRQRHGAAGEAFWEGQHKGSWGSWRNRRRQCGHTLASSGRGGECRVPPHGSKQRGYIYVQFC